MTDTSTEPKALKTLDEARKILDEITGAAKTLTMNGAVLPEPFGLVFKLAIAVDTVVDYIDDYEDKRYGVQPAASAASSAPFDPTKSAQG